MNNSHEINNQTPYKKLLEKDPLIVTAAQPSDGDEQKKLFMEGSIRNPNHEYADLDPLKFDIDSFEVLSQKLLESSANTKERHVYEQLIESYKLKYVLVQSMRNYKNAPDEESRSQAKAEYMRANIELYGEPDTQTFTSLLSEQVQAIKRQQITGNSLELRDELESLLPDSVTEHSAVPERFKPTDQTREWVRDAALELYGPMLSHIHDQPTFTAKEVANIFQEILDEEFGVAAAGWEAKLGAAKSIVVRSASKEVVVPENRLDIERETLRGLVAHEIGVHVLRSIAGEQVELEPMAYGLDASYYDSEEGLGMVMQMAVKDIYGEGGVPYYIAAGLSYFEGYDFRETYEILWRLEALAHVSDTGDVSEEAVESAKRLGYARSLRIFRGTDELPLFKDLAYFRGTTEMWKHMESIRGDDTQLALLLSGKAGVTPAHKKIVMEAPSR